MLFRIILIVIGTALFFLGAIITIQAQWEVTQASEGVLDYQDKLLSSNFAFGYGLMTLGGGLVVWGALPRKKQSS